MTNSNFDENYIHRMKRDTFLTESRNGAVVQVVNGRTYRFSLAEATHRGDFLEWNLNDFTLEPGKLRAI